MKEKFFNRIIKEAIARRDSRNSAGGKTPRSRAECPSEESLCDYLEKKLSGARQERLQKHLINCTYCQDILINTVELELEENSVKERAKEKMTEALEPVKISLAWIKGRLKLIQTDVDYPVFWDALMPVMTRSGSEDNVSSIPPLIVDSGGYCIYIQIFEQQDAMCTVQCRYLPVRRMEPESKIHADLIQEGKVLLSYPFKEDTLYFSDISPGGYTIKLYEIQVKGGTKIIANFPISIDREREGRISNE